jgi:ankyrin repeat protein
MMLFQSWEALPPDTATFTPDISPLILAAHRDNYEIIKILLDRGATLPMPHDVRLVYYIISQLSYCTQGITKE